MASLRYAGMLHDVGKLGVPTSVLQKAGRLTEAEFDAIQQHPARGREITKDLEFLGEAIEGIHLHHERIDGRGYPLGLKGSEIPEFARIIAVADAFDSMTTTRSYRGARSIEDAVVELRRCKGSQFDPVMVECLVESIDSQGWDASDTLPADLPAADGRRTGVRQRRRRPDGTGRARPRCDAPSRTTPPSSTATRPSPCTRTARDARARPAGCGAAHRRGRARGRRLGRRDRHLGGASTATSASAWPSRRSSRSARSCASPCPAGARRPRWPRPAPSRSLCCRPSTTYLGPALDVPLAVALAVTVVTIGSVVGAFPRALVGRGMHIDELARRVLTTLVAAALFRPALPWLAPAGQDPDWRLAVGMTLAAIVAAVIDAVLAAAVRSSQTRAPFRTAVVDESRALVGISSAIAATGVLIALASPIMGYWALPVFAVPLLLTQFSFRRYATIEGTYLQTIRSLSKVTEVGGYTETGHSRRVSRLAVTVGREMGVSERDLTDLEYAALMHDIGQLSLSEPIPGGATTMVAPVHQRRIAELGAEVIRQAGVLDKVADIVERQADPYRPHRGQLDTDLPVESRIIKAVNAYDDLVGASLESDRKLQAVERLQLGIDREFDPAVVDTLARIVERQTEYAY